MSESISCISCDFLKVQTFNSSSSPISLLNVVPEDQDQDDSPTTRYTYAHGTLKDQLWGFEFYEVVSNTLIYTALRQY